MEMGNSAFSGEFDRTPEQTPDEFFLEQYPDAEVQYGDFPHMSLGQLLSAERDIRSEAIDKANQENPAIRATRFIELLEKGGHITEGEAEVYRAQWGV